MTNSNIAFSVIMPTYNNSSFIRRAIKSLIDQSYEQWELIIIDDGSTDDTFENIEDFWVDKRITYHKSQRNEGLGVAINTGLAIAQYDYIAYLPADDYYFKEHLSTFATKFVEMPEAVLVFSGMQYDQIDSLNNTNDTCSTFARSLYPLQLVQTIHKKTEERWLTREEYVTDDLYLMFWHKLLDKGVFASTNLITCYWTQHLLQRHKIIGERYGGCLNYYRQYYNIQTPIRMRISKYKFVDEYEIYKNFRGNNAKVHCELKILLVGELGFNSERIYALEKAGHELYGLWINAPSGPFSYVGHLPFGNIKDISYDRNWKQNVNKIKPDIIYALGNWDAINLAYEVLSANLNIPFVWHFKEGPFWAIKYNFWNKLIYLYKYSDGVICINESVRSWLKLFCNSIKKTFILDLDLPIKDSFEKTYSKKISKSENSIHTVVTGRLQGISVDDMKILAKQNIHIHLYLENAHEIKKSEYDVYLDSTPEYFHIHKHVSNNRWIEEFSKYDAGWLHCFESKNEGNLLHATWDDLNIPARIYTLAAAGLPMIQKDNSTHIVAMQEIVKKFDIGIFYKDINNIGDLLYNKNHMQYLADNLNSSRIQFTFDYYLSGLMDFFCEIIKDKKYGKTTFENC